MQAKDLRIMRIAQPFQQNACPVSPYMRVPDRTGIVTKDKAHSCLRLQHRGINIAFDLAMHWFEPLDIPAWRASCSTINLVSLYVC